MANIVVSSGIHEFMQAADYAAARTVLGLGDSATKNVGTAETDVASGNHTHAQLHDAATVNGNGIAIVGQQISLDIGTGATQVASGNHTHAVFIGDTGNGGVAGFVPAPSSGDGAAGKYLDADGTWSVPAGGGGAGTKTYAVFTALDSQPPATNFATLDTRNSIAVLDFDGGSTNEETTFVGILPEGADVSSGLKVRIHWTATSATSGNCRWGVQFEKSGTDLDSDSFDVATEAHTATNGTAGIETITEITATSIDSITAGDRFRIKVYRDASDATNDTMTGDAELIAVEIRSAV